MNQSEGRELLAELQDIFREFGLVELVGQLSIPDEFDNPEVPWRGELERILDAIEERVVFAPTLVAETIVGLGARTLTFIEDTPSAWIEELPDFKPEKVIFVARELDDLRQTAEEATNIIDGLRKLIRE